MMTNSGCLHHRWTVYIAFLAVYAFGRSSKPFTLAIFAFAHVDSPADSMFRLRSERKPRAPSA